VSAPRFNTGSRIRHQSQQVSDDELKQFLNRSEELAPELAILVVDTRDDLAPLLRRLEDAMRPALIASMGEFYDPARAPEFPYVRPVQGEPSIAYGYLRTYVVNAKPLIVTQLRRCLRHYHAHVKGPRMVLRGKPLDFVKGTVKA
jgi:hypothetical protein